MVCLRLLFLIGMQSLYYCFWSGCKVYELFLAKLMEDIEHNWNFLQLFTEVVNQSLGDLFRCSVGEHVTNWDQVLPMVLFAYNHIVNGSISHNPFEIVTGLLLRKLIDLVPLLMETLPNIEVNAFSKHIHDLHEEVWRKIAFSNENYKTHFYLKRKFVDFKERDMGMMRIRPESYPKGTYKKLH